MALRKWTFIARMIWLLPVLACLQATAGISPTVSPKNQPRIKFLGQRTQRIHAKKINEFIRVRVMKALPTLHVSGLDLTFQGEQESYLSVALPALRSAKIHLEFVDKKPISE